MWMLIFMGLPLLTLAYIGWHFWCLLPLSALWRALIICVMVGCFLLTFANFSRSTDGMPMPLAVTCYEVANSSLIILLYLFMLFLVLDLGRLVRLIPRTLLYNNWTTVIAIVVLMTAVFTYGYLHYKHKYREEINLTTKKPMAKPLKLVMMSDLHLGYHNRRAELHRWVEMINKEHADAVLIAGDIIDMSIRPLKEEKMFEEFKLLNAPVFACLGNHEYYSGEPDAQKFYEQAGIHLLQDSATVVGDLCIIGRDDRTNRHRMGLTEIMKQADRTKFTTGRTTENRLPVQRAYPPRTSVAHLMDYGKHLRMCLRTLSERRHPLLCQFGYRHLGRQVPHRNPLGIRSNKHQQQITDNL